MAFYINLGKLKKRLLKALFPNLEWGTYIKKTYSTTNKSVLKNISKCNVIIFLFQFTHISLTQCKTIACLVEHNAEKITGIVESHTEIFLNGPKSLFNSFHSHHLSPSGRACCVSPVLRRRRRKQLLVLLVVNK